MLEISFQVNKFLIKEIMRTIAENEMNRKQGKVYLRQQDSNEIT